MCSKLTRICLCVKGALDLLPLLFSEHSLDQERESANKEEGGYGDDGDGSLDDLDAAAFPFPLLRHIEVQMSKPGLPTAFRTPDGEMSCTCLLEAFANALQKRREVAMHRLNGKVETLQSLTFLGCETAPNKALVSTLSRLVRRFVWTRSKPARTTMILRSKTTIPATNRVPVVQIARPTYYASNAEDSTQGLQYSLCI